MHLVESSHIAWNHGLNKVKLNIDSKAIMHAMNSILAYNTMGVPIDFSNQETNEIGKGSRGCHTYIKANYCVNDLMTQSVVPMI